MGVGLPVHVCGCILICIGIVGDELCVQSNDVFTFYPVYMINDPHTCGGACNSHARRKSFFLRGDTSMPRRLKR